MAYSANVGPINLGMSGLPLSPSTQLVVHVTEAAAVRPIEVHAEVSLDGGTDYRRLGTVYVPAGKKGQFATNIGRYLSLPFAGITDVRVRAVVAAATDASVDNATLQIDLGEGERTDLQDTI
jgi:hypothetical protein